mgnify:FL=1
MINGGKNMSDCSSCPSHGKCGNDSGTCGVKNNPLNKVKHVIGVMSGKGGVGKSTVSAMLAKELKKKGYSVGLLDADVTGPSAGRLMGLAGERAYAQNNMIIPVENKDGIKVISLNFMIEDEISLLYGGVLCFLAVLHSSGMKLFGAILIFLL